MCSSVRAWRGCCWKALVCLRDGEKQNHFLAVRVNTTYLTTRGRCELSYYHTKHDYSFPNIPQDTFSRYKIFIQSNISIFSKQRFIIIMYYSQAADCSGIGHPVAFLFEPLWSWHLYFVCKTPSCLGWITMTFGKDMYDFGDPSLKVWCNHQVRILICLILWVITKYLQN